MQTTDHRQAAQARVQSLITLLQVQANRAALQPLVDECESLARAIAAFHMEGIRFRMYNVDRMLTHGKVPVPEGASSLFAEMRRELEAAGFHTRSHQAPG